MSSQYLNIPPSGGGGGSMVTSVNGQTGVVVLSATDVGAANVNLSNVTATSIPVALLPSTDASKSLGSAAKRWANGFITALVDQNSIVRLDVGAGYLYSSANVLSLNTEARETSDSLGVVSSNWDSRNLVNGAGDSGIFNWTSTVAPTDGQILSADASGNVTWIDPTGGGSFPLLAPDGSNSAPSYAFSGNSGTGVYRTSDADGEIFAVSINGNETFRFGPAVFGPASDGQWNIGKPSLRVSTLFVAELKSGDLPLTFNQSNAQPIDFSANIARNMSDITYSNTGSANHNLNTVSLNDNGSASDSITVSTGDNLGSGGVGNITLKTGAGTGRGYVSVDAIYFGTPTAGSDPTGVAGAVYFNTVSHKLKVHNGTSWETITSI